MKKKQLIWHIYPSYLLLSALAMVAVAISSSRITRSFHYERTEEELTSAAQLMVQQFMTGWETLEIPAIDDLCKSMGRASGYRITVILPSGTVVGDSEEDPATMDNHGNRAEVLKAVADGVGRAERYSDTLKEEMMYVAVPLTIDGDQKGIVRTSLSLAKIDDAMAGVWHQIFLAALIIAVIAIVATVLVSRRISRPLERIGFAVQSFGQEGSYEKIPSSPISELDLLASTLNTMADQLNERISTIRQQHDELSALLACMVESVLAVDTENKLIRMNKSAEKLFQVQADASMNRSLMEVVRNADLLELARDTLASNHTVEREIVLSHSDKCLRGHGNVLRGAEGHKIGAVIVLNDITRLRNMDRVRRDFVANVSHELKTPITSILGFADTLRNGAAQSESDRDRFLEIIDKQATRLQSIVEDLLALADIEDGVHKDGIEFREGPIDSVIQNAVLACHDAATKKDIQIKTDCEEHIQSSINPALLEQAIVNLVSNAIKYSEPGTKVEIAAARSEDGISISVRDQGAGIERKHLSRLFERFYRVDKSRSRAQGGTGLGLAIVKHVAIAHGGRVAVESELEKGSTFSLFLPGA